MKIIQELNEILAEKLMELVNDDIGRAIIKTLPEEYLPDYTKNYQPILEKLLELGWSITRLSQVVNKRMPILKKYVCEINHSYLASYQYRGYGDSSGEAICRCAVSCLESKEKEGE